MSGLLETLETLLNGSGLSAAVSAQAGGLGNITGAVSSLTGGPQALLDLRQAIAQVPIPTGLDGINQLATGLGSVQFPGDLSTALGPILLPLNGLSLELPGGAVERVKAAFDLVREIVRLATGKAIGGPSGMPGSDAFRLPESLRPDEMHALFERANQILDAFGPRLDALRILELLKSGASGYTRPQFRMPQIPVLDDVMETLAAIAAWQTMSGAELSASFAQTLNRLSELILTPRQRVAAPILSAANVLGTGAAELNALVTDASPVFASLRNKTLTGAAPSTVEVVTLERAASLADRLAVAFDPATSPLAECDLIDEKLTRALLAVIRVIEPSNNLSALARSLQEQIAQIPAPPTDVFDEVVSSIQNFDLSALTDPLNTVTATVRQAVDRVNEGKETVRQTLESALTPVAEALDQALGAAGFDQIRSALQTLPAELQEFVTLQIQPKIAPIRSGVSEAVSAVSQAAEQFNPQALIAPIRNAVEQAAQVLQSDSVRSTFAEVEQALNAAIQMLERLDLPAAADLSITAISEIDVKVKAIDPATIPDAARPLLQQAVSIVTDINFTATVGDPLLTALGDAIQQGPTAVLAVFEEGMDALRHQIEGFRPSKVIGQQLDAPFNELIQALRQFKPSDLLKLLQQALDGLASRLKVFDVGAVIDPLVELHQTVKQQVEALQPSRLLKPVEEAIAAAIEKVYQATGIDTVFAGIDEVMQTIQGWIGLLADARDLMQRAATLLDQPGDAAASVRQIVDEALGKLDAVEMARLDAPFSAVASAVAAIERDALARDLSQAFQTAAAHGSVLLNSAELAALIQMARAFPLEDWRSRRKTPARDRLVAALTNLLAASDRLDAARGPWAQLNPRLSEAAGAIQERLLDYYRVSQLQGAGVFADFLAPPKTAAALKEHLRAALEDALKEPLTALVTAFGALSPYVRLMAEGLSEILGAVHAKFGALLGEGGIGGTVNSIEHAANLLRGINLQPITQPLDQLYQRIENVLDAIDPAPLRALLEAARDAVVNLLNLSLLVNQGEIDQLDEAYAESVAKIGQLAPSAVISQTLDPVYEKLLREILPILALPQRLRASLEKTGKTLHDDAVRELARVEQAFDQMLRDIPFGSGGATAGLSVNATGSAG